MCKYCLVSQTWKLAQKKTKKLCTMKLHEAKQSYWGFWESSCYFCVRGLCDVWDSDCFEFLPVVAIYRPLWNIVPCNQHWWIPDNVSQYLSQWKSRFDCVWRRHHSRGSSFCQTGLGAELWYYFATETHSHVSVLFWKKKASKNDQTKHYFLDLIICFQTAQRCHWKCVRKKY